MYLSGKMDKIIKVFNCLPEINSFIKNTKEESRNRRIETEFNRYNSNLIGIKDYLNIEVNEITNNSHYQILLI